MTSYIIDVLRQGIWASLTGGWYFDPNFTLFCNTFHLYFWLLLFCFPLGTYISLGAFNIWAWLIYSGSIGFIFAIIKILNLRLHHTFDTSEIIEKSLKLAEKAEEETEEEENANTIDVVEDESSRPAATSADAAEVQVETTADNQQTDILVDVHNAITMEDPALSSLPHDAPSSSQLDSPTKESDMKNAMLATGLSRTDSDLVDHRHVRPVYTPEMQSAVDVCKSRSQMDYPKHRQYGILHSSSRAHGLRRSGAVRRSRSSVDSYFAPFGGGRFTVSRRSNNSMFTRERHRLGLITTEHYPYSEGDMFPKNSSIKFRSRSEASSLDLTNQSSRPVIFSIPYAPTIRESGISQAFSGGSVGVDEQAQKSTESLLKLESGSLKSKSFADLEDSKKLAIKMDIDSRSSPSVLPGLELASSKNPKPSSPVQQPSKLVSSLSTAAQCTTLPFSPNEVTGEAASLSQLSFNTDTNSVPSIHRLFDTGSQSSATSSLPSFHYLFDSDDADSQADIEVEGLSSNSVSSNQSAKSNKADGGSPDSHTELLTNDKESEEPQGAVGGCPPDDQLATFDENIDMASALEPRDEFEVSSKSRDFPRSRESGPRLRRRLRIGHNISDDRGIYSVREMDGRRSRMQHHRRRRRPSLFESFPSDEMILDTLRSRRRRERGRISEETITPEPTDARHMALSHNDTSHGAMHCFQDERGNWLFYTFGESGVAQELQDGFHAGDEVAPTNIKETEGSSPSSPLPSPARFDFSFNSNDTQLELVNLREFLAQHRRSSSTSNSTKDGPPKPKFYYNFKLFPKLPIIRVPFDRLWLLALLDRNLGHIEALTAVFLSVLCALLAGLVLKLGFYHDVWLLLFFYVLASCQFSLLKSVQPDAASPTHGYNRIVAFSRPVYFCLLCAMVLLFDYLQLSHYDESFNVYGVKWFGQAKLAGVRDVSLIVLLCLPIIYTFGLLPQISTALMYCFEQIDIHVFGGTGTTSLLSAVYCFTRSVVSCALLFSFSLIGLRNMEPVRHAAFSVFCGLLVAVSFHLSRTASDPAVLWQIVVNTFRLKRNKNDEDAVVTPVRDPLPAQMLSSVKERLRSDVILCVGIAILVFAVHVSSVFSSSLQPLLHEVLIYTCTALGILLHYLLPQLRKEMPWLCLAHPLLETKERRLFEVRDLPTITWFEKLYTWLRVLERNIMLPMIFLSAISISSKEIVDRFPGGYFAYVVITVCSVKMLRSSFTDSPKQYIIMLFTYLFFKYDFPDAGETFLVDYFIISILYSKLRNFLLRLKFVYIYVAPWQIAWGSGFHAFAQPFSVPHSMMLLVQTAVSALINSPLNPFLGSAIFITSYARPLKFWERDYNTKRVDHSNTKLSSQIEKNPGSDDDNLNSLFYEHLSRSLQTSLCGDVMMGRWAPAEQGDCFVMASDNMNALVHIVEMGNGLITFQLRGLEFRGTYCQQREVEAISEGVEDDEGFCCFDFGHLPHFLSVNAAFGQRWLAWEVVVAKYVLQSYSITDNNAASTLQMFEHRKVLVTCYVKSLIYYTIGSTSLLKWLSLDGVMTAIEPLTDPSYVDVDTVFNSAIDIDFDILTQGVSKRGFIDNYLTWMQYCLNKREKPLDEDLEVMTFNLCFALSLLARRALIAASLNHIVHSSVDFFLFGLHALFKGDFRITSPRDEWVFTDMDILQTVVSPAVRMSLKLHQDHVASYEDFENNEVLYNSIQSYEEEWVISHEADPAWRTAVLSNTPHLLALRHVMEESGEEYKIIMLNKKCVSFRVIKVNRECVRGLWAGQQQELIFLRNPNAERGSIQNAKQALRNFINSSCDQPIGYPIYVSPLMTSYSGTSAQLKSIVGGEIGVKQVFRALRTIWHRIRLHCGGPCTGTFRDELPQSCPPVHGSYRSRTSNISGSQRSMRGSNVALSVLKPTRSFTLPPTDSLPKVQIVNLNFVLEYLNQSNHVMWPVEDWKTKGGVSGWNGWYPGPCSEGILIYKWVPCHRDPYRRSHIDRPICLLEIADKYVPILENGICEIPPPALVSQQDSKADVSSLPPMETV